jgi:deoxyribose-phosphate aldolase
VAVPACAVPDDFRTDVLVVLAGPEEAAPAVRSLVEAGLKVTVVAARDARTAGIADDLAACYIDPAVTALDQLVGGAKVLAVPSLSVGAAAAVANLSSTCNACNAVIRALAIGRKVVALRDGMAPPVGAPWSVRRRIEEVAGQLKGYGVVFTDPARFTTEVAKAAGASAPARRFSGTPTVGSAGRPGPSEARPAGSGGFVPAYLRANPAGVAAGAALARRETAATATVERPLEFDRDLARLIDHTLLKPEATATQVEKLCKEAIEYNFWSVCLNPTWVSLAAKLLKGSEVKVCTVIGFPLGATSSTSKALEAADVIQRGAHEVDMVLNVGALKSGQHDLVLEDIRAVVGAAKGRALVKVILETGLLTDEEKVKACELAKAAGADFVKTSTGFGPGGATPEDIALMRRTVGPEMGVKASGGIRDWDAAAAVVKAGATRIGASASVNIVKRVRPDGKKEKY